MNVILVTGAKATVGSRVAAELAARVGVRILATTRHERDISADTPYFDYADPAGSAPALRAAQTAFLFLPPGLADVSERFAALAKLAPDTHLVFMAVQGVEHRAFLPHAKAEAAIRAHTTRFTFLRPAYFMQNLETAFGEDIRDRDELVAPAGDAVFRWIDAADIARAAAVVLLSPKPHAGHAYTLAGEAHVLAKAAELLSETLGRHIRYRSPNPVSYLWRLRQRGDATGMAVAQTVIHFAERFTEVAPASPDFTYLTGDKPTSLRAYIERRRSVWGKSE